MRRHYTIGWYAENGVRALPGKKRGAISDCVAESAACAKRHKNVVEIIRSYSLVATGSNFSMLPDSTSAYS